FVSSGVHSSRVSRSQVSMSWPSAITDAYRLPPLQPTTMSMSMPSRCSTFHMPRAAAHCTLPEPMTRATRLRCGGETAAVAVGASIPILPADSGGVAVHGGGHVVVALHDGGEAAQLQHL